MSFKAKTILLLVILSLAPYVITMAFLGNAYSTDFENRLRADMAYQLGITVDRLDQSLLSLENEIRFIASLDIMNDVLTGDLDRRIFNLLLLKKGDLQLIGDFDVIDNDGNIVASSDINLIGTPFMGERFMSTPLNSTFDTSLIGELILRYDLVNLRRYFANDEHLAYSLLVDGNRLSETRLAPGVLSVQAPLIERPEIQVVLEQDRNFAFAILDNFIRSFYMALAIGILGIAVVAYLVANYIVHPILQLSSTAKLITHTQDYSKRVDVNRSDEIGQLSTAFNSMIVGMQQMILRLQEQSKNKLKLAQEKSRADMLRELSNKLSKYLSPQIYESIFSGEKEVVLGSSRKKLTIFFSDIVDFTSTTDHMESEDLTRLLNQYLREMTDIALHYGATVDKYIGDAIMIFFGDPQSQGIQEDACLCLEMAIAMQKRMRELEVEWLGQGITKPFSIRIGIHTGYCTVGNFGTESRMDYTLVGSAVNLASRIESAADAGSIYISEDCYLLVKDAINCQPATTVTPKGFNEAMQLYKVSSEDSAENVLTVNENGIELKYQPGQLSEAAEARLQELLKELAK